MLMNEIEIAGSSISVKCWKMMVEDAMTTFDIIMSKSDKFDIETELPGFHDCEYENSIIRGFYSVIIPFEVEHLVYGVTAKKLYKRIESCEFIITEKMVLAFGKSNPQKLLATALSAITGQHVDNLEFEFQHMNQIQERMTSIKSIVVSNPKEKEVRRARLAGHMESYTEYNIVDPRNHGIESVSGLIETPLGPLTINVGRKGDIRLNVRKGMIMTTECLEWILALIIDEKKPNKGPCLFDGMEHI